MAGDWIKMRVWLRRDPRVATMADFIAEQRDFMDWLTDPVRRTCSESAHEHITRDVTRAITVCSLLEIWGVARERGDRVGNDLVIRHCSISSLDDICGVPSIGLAMEYVDWAEQSTEIDAKGRSISLIRLPNFFEEAESPSDKYKRQHAEAQARYRAKKTAESGGNVTSPEHITSDVTRDVTVTHREEKRREEKYTPKPPKGEVVGFPPGFDRFWSAYPKKQAKPAAVKAFARLKPDDSLMASLMAALEVQVASKDWQKDGGQFIPLASTWLNNRRWEDEMPAQKADPFAGAL